MNWEAIGAVSEIIGAAAVLATLAFLAIQIRDGQQVQRESNEIARSEARDKAYDHFAGFRRLVASDAEVTRIWLAGCAEEALDPADEERFRQLATDYLFTYVMWIQRMPAVGLPERAESATSILVAELQRRPGLQPHWAEVVHASPSVATHAVSSALSI